MENQKKRFRRLSIASTVLIAVSSLIMMAVLSFPAPISRWYDIIAAPIWTYFIFCTFEELNPKPELETSAFWGKPEKPTYNGTFVFFLILGTIFGAVMSNGLKHGLPNMLMLDSVFVAMTFLYILAEIFILGSDPLVLPSLTLLAFSGFSVALGFGLVFSLTLALVAGIPFGLLILLFQGSSEFERFVKFISDEKVSS